MAGARMSVRPAVPEDAEAIVELLRPYARTGLVLPRTAAEIREHAGNFLVALQRGAIMGCVALRDYGSGLYEVRSLAVHAASGGQGLGSRLVRAVMRTAVARGADRVFALTLRPNLFQRLGFRQVAKEMFPQKVWTDCRKCAKRECCDEIAMLKRLRPGTASGSPGPSVSARGKEEKR